MAVGDILTLRKTETGIPWHIALGAMQHLTPQYARIMLAQPWYTWNESGVPTLEITKISVQPPQGAVRPIISIGLSNISGIGAIQNGTLIAPNTITLEGDISANCETQCIEKNVVNDVLPLGGTVQDGNNFVMYFYTTPNNDIYVGCNYGTGSAPNKNRTTSFQFTYRNLYNNAIITTATTSNNRTYPSLDKYLYINGTNVNSLYNAVDLNCLFKICSFEFKTSVKMFVNKSYLDKYGATGDEDGNIENLIPKKEISKDHISTLYFYCQERRGTNPVDFEEWHNHSIRFLVENTTSEGKPLNWQTSVIGYLDYGEGAYKYSNHKIVKFHQNSGTIIKCEELINGEWLERAQPQLDVPFSAYRVGMQCTDGYTYVGDIQTNMMIFKSLEDYNEWKENPSENTWGILENVLSNALVNTTMNTNNINFDVGLGECWILDQNNIKRMANLFNMQLNADLSNIVGNMLIGLGMYDNPVDVVCDLFVLPFDVSEFVTSELSEFALGIQPQEEDEG